MDNKQILKSLYDKRLNVDDVLTDVELCCVHSGQVSDETINKAKISKELYDVILKNCGSTGLPTIICHYDNGVLWPGIGRGQR